MRSSPDRAVGRSTSRAAWRPALAQGAGLHYLNGRTGMKDLDVWTLHWP
jgi:hypothetical protein